MAATAPDADPRRARIVAWIVVAATAAVLTAAFAVPYATQNQVTYLLDPLHRAMPELFRRDWLLAAPAEQPVFGWLAHWLYVIDPEGATAMIAASFAVTFATYIAVYGLTTAVCRGPRALAVFVVFASWLALTMGRAMGGSYLLAGYLQPSAPATLGWIVAMAALVRGRYLLCGVVLAAAGALHINFLVLGIGLFTLGALARRDVGRRALVELLAPQLIVLAVFAPGLVAAATPSDEALTVLTRFHAPGHYLGSRVIVWSPALVAWQLAALAALAMLDGAVREVRALWRLSLVSCAIAVGAGLIICIPAFERLTQLFCSRVAPFGQLGCEILVAAALVAPSASRSPARRAWLGAAVAAALVLDGHFMKLSLLETAAAVAVVAAALAVPARLVRHTGAALAVVALAVALWASPRGAGLTTVPAGTDGELALASWAQRSTPTDALFFTPPRLARLRLLARRSIVGDTKSPPLRPDALVAWYHRLCAIVARSDAPTHEAIEQAWYTLPLTELERIARTFGADYVVVDSAAQISGAPVYRNAEFAVYRVE